MADVQIRFEIERDYLEDWLEDWSGPADVKDRLVAESNRCSDGMRAKDTWNALRSTHSPNAKLRG